MAQSSTPEGQRVLVPTLVSIGLASVFVISSWAAAGSQMQKLHDARAEINNTQVQTQDVGREVSQKQVHLESVSLGVDQEQLSEDVSKGRVIADLIGTWNSYEQYQENRATLMRAYEVSEDSVLLTEVMPVVRNRMDGSGKQLNRIDTMGLNMAVQSVQTSLTQVQADRRVYRSVVTTGSTSRSGRGSSDQVLLLSFAIDTAGDIVDIEAFPSDVNTVVRVN